MGGAGKAILINEKDNVAVALVPLDAGKEVSVKVQGRIEKIRVLSDIPMGHKFALKDMKVGEVVIKYGEPIAQAAARITRGEHVHIHNVVSLPRGGSR